MGTISVQSTQEAPASAAAEVSLTPDWVAHGNVWANPFTGAIGGGVGIQLTNSLDITASASSQGGKLTGSIGIKGTF